MKKLIFALILGTFCFLGSSITALAQQQPGVGEDFVKSLTQSFNESDVFTTVDNEDGFTKSFVDDGFAKCYRWYYRPIIRPVRYVWRPVYYRPYYTYYRYYVRPYAVQFSWTTVCTTTVYKSASDTNGAMIDSDPAPGSPLAQQGLRKGDIITHVDGQPLRTLQDLNRATANSKLTVQKGSQTKFAGNLLKSADENLMKSFDGMQEVEAGTLLTNAEIKAGNYDMYKFFDRNTEPVFGVKAVDNSGNGVKVTEVVAGLPGQKSGFEVDDIILEINGTKIFSEKDYSDAIDCAGKVARMKVLCGRTGQTVDADVVLNK
ncbi:MAG: PDZ domain-containing protein [Planctomycetaceae bacterium]|jgi:membrane-associated protease RseP (regulator of RpoE activity)|nr:PDZ domain-containing protein [Planctomycetaceae bacterium]